MKKLFYIFLCVLFIPVLAYAGWRTLSDGTLKPTGTGTNVEIEGSVSAATTRVEVTGTSTLTEQQIKGTYITNYGMSSGGDTTLPAYAGTAKAQIKTEAASQSWSLKPPSGEAFLLDGTALDADDEIDCGEVAGDFAIIERVRTGASTYQWQLWSGNGLYADGGAS